MTLKCSRCLLRSIVQRQHLVRSPIAHIHVSAPGLHPPHDASIQAQTSDDTTDLSIEAGPSDTTLASAKARAWYLEDDDEPSASSSSSASPFGTSRRPRFTTFDPSRTTSDTGQITIQPLPLSSPEWLRPLHTFLTTSDEALEVMETDTVVFMPTTSAPSVSVGEGDVLRPEGVGGVGPTYDWVVVGVVKGIGKGVVGRADRAVRMWLRKNPHFGRVEGYQGHEHHKLPRVPEDSDWSMIGVPDRKLSINLFTAAGRERWDLEELWTGQKRLA